MSLFYVSVVGRVFDISRSQSPAETIFGLNTSLAERCQVHISLQTFFWYLLVTAILPDVSKEIQVTVQNVYLISDIPLKLRYKKGQRKVQLVLQHCYKTS